MGRSPCCVKEELNRGAWTTLEDNILVSYIKSNGVGGWSNVPKRAGLKRCGKSCRLRWVNYLRPDIKRGNISGDEEDLIVRLHNLLGNRWSLIAGRLPGRTNNEIKNYWNTTLVKRLAKSSTAASSPPPPSRTIAKMGLLTPSNNHLQSPPPTAIRPRVTRAKPKKPIDPPPPLNDNQTQFPSLPPSIQHDQGTSLLPTSEEVRDGDVGDLGFLDLGCEIFGDDSPNGLITIDDKMLEDWAAIYDSTFSLEQGKDMLDLESLAFFLDELKFYTLQ